ncbi:MarR family winged helix-turn-helix transcriptional regulator [Emticicia sp. BO119]|uniref:MarR family winged helix-turn-helix transcriptional regulator n=1 Tax=Emticicia sp. BO119 TaxID=2757768 RepID=UPI0015F0C465|nr:MarR family transcriptional regulator [Emticicia sp. BO119]MBA4853781.1 MarR family transcriptional regulator [Emticicia sp. BO119]
MNQELSNEQIQTISELGKLFSDATILMHEAIARKAGLTGTDHKYLGILIQKGAMTAGEFAQLTGLTGGAVTGLMDRLEKKSLARRAFDKDDRRKIMIVPETENAMQLLGGIFALLQSKIVGIISTFSAGEKRAIEKYLRSTMAVMNEITYELNNEQ